MNHSNALYGDEPNEPPRECMIQPPAAHFISKTSPSNTIPVVSYIMGRINNHAIDNGDVKVHTSYFPVEFNSESVPDTDTPPIKSIDDYEIYHLLEFFHSEHDEYLLDVDLQMLQSLLLVYPTSKLFTVSTVLFHTYGRVNVAVTNCMSRFSMFVPTKATVKLVNRNTGHPNKFGLFYATFLTVQ